MNSNSILKQILQQAHEFKNQNKILLAVFDLDSTLFDLRKRKEEILKSFANEAKFQSQFPKECEKLKAIQIKSREFGIREGLERLGFELKKDAEFLKILLEYWEYYFFHNEFLKFDFEVEGASQYVQKLYQAGAHIVYLTGRDRPRMLSGTIESLRRHQFPIEASNIELILKNSAGDIDELFKLEVMIDLCSKYEQIYLFENEPVNINLIEKKGLKVDFVYIDLNHSGREEVGPHHHRIFNFKL